MTVPLRAALYRTRTRDGAGEYRGHCLAPRVGRLAEIVRKGFCRCHLLAAEQYGRREAGSRECGVRHRSRALRRRI